MYALLGYLAAQIFTDIQRAGKRSSSKYSPVISVAVYLELAKQKQQKKTKKQNKKTYFQEYQKYKLNCDTYALKPVYNMISSMLREACLRWI